MLILACDTSSTNCSACISEDGIVLSELNINYDKQHSTLLMPMIETLFQNVNKEAKDVDYFVVNKGPGSFTGLRIGLSVFKAMANALNKPLIAIDTFMTQAYPYRFFKGNILVLNDALRKTFYSTMYSSNGESIEKVITDDVRNFEDLKEITKDIEENLLIIGDCVQKFSNEIKENFPKAKTITKTEALSRASNLCLVAEYLINNDSTNETDINPYYMRKPQAEREYDEKHGIKN